MKLLLTGDLHIGRSSSRIPARGRRDDFRASSAWDRIVRLAIQERVAVVCLSGDIADQDNKFWESIGPLERGVHQLAKANVRTVAVSGNHDFDVLARLADQLPSEHFTLLGRGGTWQRITILGDGGRSPLHIDGWSFPRQRVDRSPLTDYELDPDPSVPILGMVHGDLDVPNSPYAPLELARLQALPPAGWLLGHIHAPRLVTGRSWVLYPGSPQALDPGEEGPHGVWLLSVEAGHMQTPDSVPLSSVWYQRLSIDVGGATTDDDVEKRMMDGIRTQAASIADMAGSHLVHVNLRLRLEGSTSVAHRMSEITSGMIKDLSLPVGGGSLAIESVDIQTTPAINLVEHAATRTAPGAVARMLLELDRAESSQDVLCLIRETMAALERVEGQKDFASLDRRKVTESTAREHLRTQGRKLLTQLISQSA